jgi:DNA-directed RNA polymerase specialized sigma24 family protein
MSQRYSLAKQYNPSLASRVMENVWRSIRPTTATKLLAPYDHTKGASFSTWLYRLVALKAIDDYRRSKPKEKPKSDENIERIACARSDPYRSQGRRWGSSRPNMDEGSSQIPATLYWQLEGSAKE